MRAWNLSQLPRAAGRRRRRSERRKETACERDERKRVKLNRPRHRLTFSLMYLMMRTTVSPTRSILSFLADINMLYYAVSLALSLWVTSPASFSLYLFVGIFIPEADRCVFAAVRTDLVPSQLLRFWRLILNLYWSVSRDYVDKSSLTSGVLLNFFTWVLVLKSGISVSKH